MLSLQFPTINLFQQWLNKSYTPKFVDAWALGVAAAVGGQYVVLHMALEAGFGSFIIAVTIMTSAYASLILSLAEIASAIPLLGGAFRMTRCLVGKGPGFIAGIFEALSYIFVIANASSYISRIIATVFHWGLHGQVAFSAMFYSSVVLIMQNPLRFWRFVMFFAVVSVCILLMYCIGSLRHFNFLKYAPIYSESWTTGNYRAGHRIWMAGGGLHFFEIFPLAAYFFSGIQSLTFINSDVDNSTLIVPRSFVASVMTLTTTSVLLLFMVCSSYPGTYVVSQSIDPLSEGFSQGLNIPIQVASILSVPAMYSTALGCSYGYGKIVTSMAKSNAFYKNHLSFTNNNQTPIQVYILGSLLGFGISVVSNFHELEEVLHRLGLLFIFFGYILQCYCIYGAIYAGIIFSISLIAILSYQKDCLTIISTFLVILALLYLYYWFLARKQQEFNAEELAITFKAFVVKHNLRRIRFLRTGSKSKQVAPISLANIPKYASTKILPWGKEIHTVRGDRETQQSTFMGKGLEHLKTRIGFGVSRDKLMEVNHYRGHNRSVLGNPPVLCKPLDHGHMDPKDQVQFDESKKENANDVRDSMIV